MRKTTKPAIARAVLFLRNNITNGTWKNNERISTCKELAQTASVAYGTMHAALNVLQKEGILSLKQKTGITLAKAPAKKSAPALGPPPVVRWLAIKESLRKDLLYGPFHDKESLPSLKELTTHYATGFNNVKKAAEALRTEGLLRTYKKHYLVDQYKPKHSVNKIFLFINEQVRLFSMWSFDQDRISIFIRSLENDCALKNIVLEKVWFSQTNKGPYDFKQVLGSIVLYHSSDEFSEQNLFVPFVEALSGFNKPIVIITMYTGSNPERLAQTMDLSARRRIFLSTTYNDKEAGFRMGKFLVGKGHQKICLFAHYSKHPIWQERYLGVKKAFEIFGHKDAVSPFYFFDSPKAFADLLTSHDIKTRASLNAQYDYLQSLQTTLKNSILFPYIKEKMTSSMQEMLNNINLLQTHLPFFRKALLLENVTAWVCAEDYLMNYAAQSFLLSQRIKIPEQIGLAGFGDQIESSFNNLTSYRFDYNGMAQKALSLILYPKYAQRITVTPRSFSFDVDGMVIDRASI